MPATKPFADGRESVSTLSAFQRSLRKRNVALEKSNHELRESNEELKHLSFALVHDLKEPLRSIQAMAELFACRNKTTLNEDSARMLGFITSGADRMMMLVENILEFARMNQHPDRHSIEARATAEAASRALQEAVSQGRAKIVIHSLPKVLADEGQLFRLFLNLLSNAIKYHGERAPEIHISASCQEDECIFSVRDNGVGIEHQYYEQIFKPLRRLSSSSKAEGSGMGLAICKRIVENHDGRIWVESEPGQGSAFYFSLPCASDCCARKPNLHSEPGDRRYHTAAGCDAA